MQKSVNFTQLYHNFDSPIAAFDCGDKCSPHNEGLVPFCCDTGHIVPSAYLREWRYLSNNTDLWHLWRGDTDEDEQRLNQQTPAGQVLIECQGHLFCQRNFRSITCRAFPFFPYIDSQGEFLGLSYYWEFEDRCWVISNLNVVSRRYITEFIDTFNILFLEYPEERINFQEFSSLMRADFQRRRRAIVLLHKDGWHYKISPESEHKKRVSIGELPKFGVYRLIVDLPFPDEQ